MGKDYEQTMKYVVDLSELKSGIRQANNQIKSANAAFKLASSGMDDWRKSSDGLSAKIKQLETVLSAESNKLKSYRAQLEQVTKAEEENRKRAELLQAQYKQVAAESGKDSEAAQKLKASLETVQQEQQRNNETAKQLSITLQNQQGKVNKAQLEMDKYSQKLAEMESASGKLKTTISEQESELEDLKRKYTDVVLAEGKNSASARDLAGQIKLLSGTLQKNKGDLDSASGAANKMDRTMSEAKGSAEGMSDGFTVLKGALAGLVTGGINWCIEQLKELAFQGENAMSKFQAATGTSTAAMGEFKKEILDLYKKNFGESIDDIAESMAEVKQQSNEVDPSKLKALTKNAIELRDTFGFEVGESLRAAKMLMDQFGISSEDAFNLIAQGAQNGLNKNGDLLDSINEYAVHYKQMGVSADGFFNSLENGSKAGTFSVDKLGDAYKEFGIRARDTAKSTTEGFQLLGLNADQMRGQFAKGGDSAAAATKKVVSKLTSMDDKVKQNQAGVDLFGTMWEDLGAKGVEALMDVSGAASGTKKTMEDIDQQRYDNALNQLQSVGRAFKINVLQPLVESIVPALADFGNWFTSNIPAIVGGLAAFGSAMAAVKVAEFAASILTAVEEMKAATTAAGTLTAALGPAGMIAALAGVVVALGIYAVSCAKANEPVNKNLEATEQLIDEQDELKKSLDESKKTRDKNTDSTKVACGQADLYIGKIERLSKKEHKNSAEKRLLKQYVDDLNGVMPNLNLAYDEEADKLSKSTQEIRNNIAAQKDLLMAEAAHENLKSIAEDQIKNQMQYTKLKDQQAQNEDAYQKAQKTYAKAKKEFDDAGIRVTEEQTQAFGKAAKNVEQTKRAVDETTTALKKNRKEKKSLDDQYSSTEKIQDTYNRSAELEQSLDTLISKANKKGVQVPKAVSEGIRAGSYVLPDSVKNLKNLIDFNDLAKKAGLDGTKIPKKLAESISKGKISPEEAVKKLAADIKQQNNTEFQKLAADAGVSAVQIPNSLAKGIDSGAVTAKEAVKRLQDIAKFDSSAVVAAANASGITDVNSYRDGLASGKTTLAAATESLSAEVNKKLHAKDTRGNGQSDGGNYASGLSSKKGAAGKAGTTLGSAAEKGASKGSANIGKTGDKGSSAFVDAFRARQKSANQSGSALGSGAAKGASSGSSAIDKLGSSRAGSFVSGVQSKAGAAAGAGRAVGARAKSGASSGSSGSSSIGSNMVSGIISGIAAHASALFGKMRSLASGALAAAKKALGINSPSRVFRDVIGKGIVEGTAVGIGKYTGLAETAIVKLSGSLLARAKKATSTGKFADVGKSVVSAFEKGVDSSRKSAVKSVTKAVDNYVSAISKHHKKSKGKYTKWGKEVISQYTKAIESAADKAKTTLSKKLMAIAEATQSKYDELAKLQESMDQKLADYGDLYTTGTSGVTRVNDLSDNIAAMKTYQKNMEALKGKVGDNLISKIAEMDVTNAIAYSTALLRMSDSDLAAYNRQYEQKVKLADSISKKFYKSKVDQVKNDYVKKVKKAFADVKTQLEGAGENAIAGFLSGMTKKSKKSDKSIAKIADRIVKAMRKALKINSPSKVFEQLGMYSGQGYEIGLANSLANARMTMASAVQQIQGGGTTSVSYPKSTTTNTYNFYQTNNSPKALSRVEIYRQTQNQLALARRT